MISKASHCEMNTGFNRQLSTTVSHCVTFNYLLPVAIFLVIYMLIGCKKAGLRSAGENGFVQIFDGETLEGWKGDPIYWSADNGRLVGEVTPSTILERNTFIVWQGDMPSDFELKVEYRISENGNSGINYRSEKVEGVPYALRGYQADLDGRNRYTGSNYEERSRTTLAAVGQKVDLSPVPNAGSLEARIENNRWTASKVTGSLGLVDSLKAGIKKEDWNEYHLVVRDNHLQHYVNGVLMSDVTDRDSVNRRFDGYLGVQVHVGPPMKVEYRNFRLKKLSEKDNG